LLRLWRVGNPWELQEAPDRKEKELRLDRNVESALRKLVKDEPAC
jgi:hypothetical protein